MGVMRGSRLASIAVVVAMVMAVLAVCPCPAMAGGRSEDPHRCCAGKAGLTVAPAAPTCCLEEASDPRLADTRVAPAPFAGWAAVHAMVSVAPPLPVLPHVTVAVPLVAAPPILRI
jgi:hypothetical protein